ncbi:B2 bradykinin receptor [Latimeria chalumnae]|uniref:B2 bradykinin receptor n=1 Tax=Latimeria chalumnae TaxID=7897 RepID=UPI0003C128EA|nr:PREDICTED: B2 bradykinin receptor [Latimeria chalumnae]|eukprot:XP_006009216.1 PREDICTED: B2 bradykinin receptor [Latimeria chalumnae]
MSGTMNFSEDIGNLSLAEENQTGSEPCPTPAAALEWIFTLQPIYLWIISVLGIIGNTVVLSVFCLHKKGCTVAEIYLANLAAADLVLCCCLPFWSIYIANHFNWPFGQFLCQTVSAVIYINLYSSLYFLVMISIDRYLALVRTMSIGRMRRSCYAKIICLIIWMFGVLMSTPMIMFRSVSYIPNYNITACILKYPNENWHFAINILLNIVGFLIPLAIITFCSTCIIITLQNNKMKKFKAVQTEKKATNLILAVLLMFFICWMPFEVFTFLDTLFVGKVISGCTWEDLLDIGSIISTFVAYSNSFLNPMLYAIAGKHFRTKAREVHKQLFIRRNTISSTIMQTEDTTDFSKSSLIMSYLKTVRTK